MTLALSSLQISDHFIPDINWENIPEFSVI
ncbi:MAG: hypothetical protein ACJARD_001685, partial [Alphaproteobacteria bacterium]